MRWWLLLLTCAACGTRGGPGAVEHEDAAAAPREAGCGGLCAVEGGRPEVAPDLSPEEGQLCGRSIELVLEAVDRTGQAFPRDGEGVFLVPIDADDFAFDTGKSRNVSGREVVYTFDSDCYPKVAVRAPVLGGFNTHGFWIDKRCQFGVEVLDLGCPEERVARAQRILRFVPPP
jgi:hypothetical protein